MFIRIAAIVGALFLSMPAMAAPPSGVWAAMSEGTVIYRFDIEKTSSGIWAATWDRPAKMSTDGEIFSHVAGPVEHRAAKKVVAAGEALELTFDDLRPGSSPDVFRLKSIDDSHVTAEYLTLSAFGIKVEPLLLVREAPNASMGSWDQNQTYPTSLYRATNVEMTAIFDADQTSRQTWPPKDFAMQSEADRQRRVHTGELLDQGLLHSADDLYHAAFVYQHGDNEADYLKAHVLATAAVARGKAAAKWIAAATLDRYLLAIGRPQVFGTQYMTPKDKATTQEPYDRTAISDALRAAMGVPSLNLQTQTLIQMKNAEPAKKPE